MKNHAPNSMKTLSKAVWTNLKTGFIILTKEVCWMAGGLSHKMEVRQLEKQASREEAAYGRRLLDALQSASQNLESGAEAPCIPTPKDAEAIRERILFIREEIVRLEKLRLNSRTRHEATIRTRFQQDEKEVEAAEPVVLDIPDIPYTPEPEDLAPEQPAPNATAEGQAQAAPEAQPKAKPEA
ncbi:MAG: hypothetical protein R3Y11_03205 [Pseudomonadota bacterium]